MKRTKTLLISTIGICMIAIASTITLNIPNASASPADQATVAKVITDQSPPATAFQDQQMALPSIADQFVASQPVASPESATCFHDLTAFNTDTAPMESVFATTATAPPDLTAAVAAISPQVVETTSSAAVTASPPGQIGAPESIAVGIVGET